MMRAGRTGSVSIMTLLGAIVDVLKGKVAAKDDFKMSGRMGRRQDFRHQILSYINVVSCPKQGWKSTHANHY